MKFKDLKPYLSRVVRISVYFKDGHYDDYTLVSDIPEGRYDEMYVFGVGKVDVEFSRDVYRKPDMEPPKRFSGADDFLGAALEVVIQDHPREDVDECGEGALRFGDLRKVSQVFGGFSVVKRENWDSEIYEWCKEIPHEYDHLFVYGIGLEDDSEAMASRIDKYRDWAISIKQLLDCSSVKRMVFVLSETPREDLE